MAGVVSNFSPTAHNWHNVRVFITGHTGFKGSWLAFWLQHLGAKVYGYALPPPEGGVFNALQLHTLLAQHTIGNIEHAQALTQAMQAAQPTVVFHLAAQPLVLAGYQDPVNTYATNVMGTVNVLQAVRHTPSVRAVINVTTDKCYNNLEQGQPFAETDPLGGHDPYSASKACAELVAQSYRQAFLQAQGVWLACARAGNVIGGGDVAPNRLLPDVWRAAQQGHAITLRAPHSTRPWQHVLDAVRGYLWLAQALLQQQPQADSAFNFAPPPQAPATVGHVATVFAQHINAPAPMCEAAAPTLHEAHTLQLCGQKAVDILGHSAQLPLAQSINLTAQWYTASLAQNVTQLRALSVGHLGML